MNKCILVLIVALLLQSCDETGGKNNNEGEGKSQGGSEIVYEEPFYTSYTALGKQRKLIEDKFDAQVQYRSIVLSYVDSIGNFVSVQTKERPDAKVTAWWSFGQPPVVISKGSSRVVIYNKDGWNKTREELIEPDKAQMFSLNQLCWGKVPAIFAAIKADMKKKGIENAETNVLTFDYNFGPLQANIIATTMGGGSSFIYGFDMNGNMVGEPIH